MVSFYPGPSKVYPEVPTYVKDAYEEGILSANHRSPEFIALSSSAIELLKTKLHVPEDYTVLFSSSATECWEIISQSLVNKSSFHIYNGAFGEKWYQYAKKLQPAASGFSFDYHYALKADEIATPPEAEMIALTHNETSNGTALSEELIRAIRAKHPEQLIAIDATSSMAGVALDFSLADIWYASVQKCFGLPAGMAVMICSPQVLKKAKKLNERQHYNSLLYMAEMMDHWQTTYTPNVMNIYLLKRVMEARPDIEETQKMLLQRYDRWIEIIKALDYADLLVSYEEVRSKTVIPLEADTMVIDKLKVGCKEAGIILGNGYGAWKDKSLRIANFPAIEDWEIQKLTKFLKSFSI